MKVKTVSFYKHIDFLLVDEISLFISFVLAYLIYLGNPKNILNSTTYLNYLFVLLITNTLVCYFINPYKNILKRPFLLGTIELFKLSFILLLLISFFLFITKQGELVSRMFTLLIFILFFFISFILRYIRKKYLLYINKNDLNKNAKKLLIITTKQNIDGLLEDINKYNYGNYNIAGICILDENLVGNKLGKYNIVASKKDVLSYVCHNWVDEVFVAAKYTSVDKKIFDGLATAGITTNVLMEKIDEFNGQEQHINKILNKTVTTFSLRTRTKLEEFTKRCIDIFGGIVGCLFTLLLTIIIGPIIYVKSPGPIFFKQERIGQNGKRFYMYKFRSMVLDADTLKKNLMKQNRIKDGMMFKVKNDPRIIPGIGNFIRSTSLDEFPQFINVLIGDMSLVGTRPPTVDEWVKYKLEHRIRMTIKPGITGLWQVNGRSKITDFNKVIEYDTKYINNWSLGLDIEILFKTILVLLKSRDEEAM